MGTDFSTLGIDLALVSARATSALASAPLLGGRPLPLPVALILSAPLAVALAPSTPWPDAAPSHLELAARFVVEVAIGLSLGWSAKLALFAFEAAGGLAGQIAGLHERPLTSLYGAVVAGAFLLAGGHHAVVSAIATSLAVFPSGSPRPDIIPAVDGFVALFASAVAGAVAVASPAFAAALAADSVFGIASRLAPGATLDTNAPALRSLCVQIAALGALVAAVRFGVDFIGEALSVASKGFRIP